MHTCIHAYMHTYIKSDWDAGFKPQYKWTKLILQIEFTFLRLTSERKSVLIQKLKPLISMEKLKRQKYLGINGINALI